MVLANGFCFKMTYKSELIRSMQYLAKFNDTIFIGQSVKYSGNAIFNTLADVPNNKKIETPVLKMYKWVYQLDCLFLDLYL